MIGVTATLYGIPNCDTVRCARAWLQSQGCVVQFVDFKKTGVAADRLDAWVQAAGWERVLNRQGTTWRKLDEALRMAVVDAASATKMMRDHASVIKRPIVEWPDGAITVGFDTADWARRIPSVN